MSTPNTEEPVVKVEGQEQTPEEPKEPVTEPKTEDTPQEPEPLTKEPEVKEVEQTPEERQRIEMEDIKREIGKALLGEKEEEKQVDKYQKMADDFYKEHGRAPTWTEFIPFIAKDVRDQMDTEQQAEVQKQDEIKKQQEEAHNERLAEYNKFIDGQLEDLYSSNKLPRVKDKNDPNDYGVVARKALFQAHKDLNDQLQKEGKPPVYSIKETFYEHFQMPQRPVAGYDAPVSMGRGAGTTQQGSDIDYKEIHSARSFEDLL